MFYIIRVADWISTRLGPLCSNVFSIAGRRSFAVFTREPCAPHSFAYAAKPGLVKDVCQTSELPVGSG
jgi:hypothetical protein